MGTDLQALPDALRDQVNLWLERYGEKEHIEALTRLVACSEFAGSVILREKAWFLDNVTNFSQPPALGARGSLVPDDATPEQAKALLRRFRNRFMLQVIWREVFELADLDETLSSLSRLADHMLDAATRYDEHPL